MVFSEKINQIAERAEVALAPIFARIDKIAFENTPGDMEKLKALAERLKM
jgi:hypothetical protein